MRCHWSAAAQQRIGPCLPAAFRHHQARTPERLHLPGSCYHNAQQTPQNALTNPPRPPQAHACPAQRLQHRQRQPGSGQRPQSPRAALPRLGHQCHPDVLRGQHGQGPAGERRGRRADAYHAGTQPQGHLEQEPGAAREGHGWPAFRADYHGRSGTHRRMWKEKKSTGYWAVFMGEGEF